MKKYEWKMRSGFGVFLESGDWRIAYHAYEKGINDLSAVRTWGSHVDSEEAFILKNGNAWLFRKDAAGKIRYDRLKQDIYLAETSEEHILILEPGAQVLIVENKDMKNTVNTDITEAELREICDLVKGVEK